MEQYTVRGIGRTASIDDLSRNRATSEGGNPGAPARHWRHPTGPLPRQGATTRDGKGETVSGMAIMLKAENGKRVIERVKAKIASIQLPPGVKINPFYDQSSVIDGTVARSAKH